MYWFAVALLLILPVLVLTHRRRSRSPAPPKSIVVDGYDVMHWGGEASEVVLKTVIDDLKTQGLTPIVVFNADAGYKLRDHYLDEAGLARICGLRAQSVILMDHDLASDKRILEIAEKSRLTVVSNSQYSDWSVTFPFVRKRGRIKRGTWKNGAVVWAKS
jgi:hypothetical protein